MTVVVLRWPAESHERERCKSLGVPRLLVLEGRDAPPQFPDALEDWVRPPLNPADLRRRTAALEARALAGVPLVDGADILRFAGKWLALPAADARLMRALVDAYGSVVSRDCLARLVWPDGPPRRNAFDLRVLRLRRRIAPLQLAIRTVWRRGYVLDTSETPAEVGPPNSPIPRKHAPGRPARRQPRNWHVH